MGASAAGRARPSWGDVRQPAHDQIVDDVARIAESVRDVVGARATMVSRGVDDEWLEVMTVVGEPSEAIVPGLRWRRSDLDRLLASAEQLGRIHATKRHAVSYAEIPTLLPETERYVGTHLGLLLAPLLSATGDLLGVLATEGPVDIVNPAPGTCELVELYAGQARLALSALHDQELLTERLRMSYAVQRILDDVAGAEDLAELLDAVADGLGEMMQARGAWACAELEPGTHVDAASYHSGASQGLGADVCTFLEPMVAKSLQEGRPLTHETEPLLGRLARVAGLEQALLAPIGDGTGTRGALLVLRAGDDDAWSADDHDAMFALGRRLGTVADRVRGQRRDQESLEALLRLDESRRDLVASITHDLKTPLTAIALNTELLESDGRLAEAGSHPVEAIRRSADRLAGLVDDLVAMARAEEGASTLVEVDLVGMVRDACGHVETDATLRGVTFEMVAPDELRATVDAQALARVFANLVGNAVKFSLPRGRVVLDLNRIGDVVEFRCSDDGIGIPQERLDSLFDITSRTPDARIEEFPGSGIGLAICERIVTRLGGEITVESNLGQGSTFTVRIPC